jgi:hypothetical protein
MLTKILVIIRRQHWSFIRQNFGHHSPATLVFHSPKFWSLVRQKIGRWLIFEVLNIYLPKNWSLVDL